MQPEIYRWVDPIAVQTIRRIEEAHMSELLVEARHVYDWPVDSRERRYVYQAMVDRIHKLHGKFLTSTVEINKKALRSKLGKLEEVDGYRGAGAPIY